MAPRTLSYPDGKRSIANQSATHTTTRRTRPLAAAIVACSTSRRKGGSELTVSRPLSSRPQLESWTCLTPTSFPDLRRSKMGVVAVRALNGGRCGSGETNNTTTNQTKARSQKKNLSKRQRRRVRSGGVHHGTDTSGHAPSPRCPSLLRSSCIYLLAVRCVCLSRIVPHARHAVSVSLGAPSGGHCLFPSSRTTNHMASWARAFRCIRGIDFHFWSPHRHGGPRKFPATETPARAHTRTQLHFHHENNRNRHLQVSNTASILSDLEG